MKPTRALVAFFLLVSACGSRETKSDGAGATGGAAGTTASGGSGESGGSTSTGGSSGANSGVGGGGTGAGVGSGGDGLGGTAGAAGQGESGAAIGGGSGSGSGNGGGGGGGGGNGSGGGSGSGAGGSGGSLAEYRNPVIPGFHPDPSVCRVGDDYYLVTSSFEYFPGIPIFTSRDLVNWRQIGHVLTRASQDPLANVASSEGVFAPTIRYANGTFYVVSSIVSGGDLFYVTATDPAGSWSEPHWLNESVFGMDPSLFFDDDGKVYYTRHGDGEQGGIFQSEINLTTGQLAAAPREIWGGTGGVWPEGPHLYKINGTYYLMIAEGGTSFDHMETVARSSSPWGPFESFSGNPILTHKGRTGNPIQATGHGDLVQTQNGSYWLVFLGIRPPDGSHHHLGRETFLAPVTFNAQNWPVVNGGNAIALTQSTMGLPPVASPPAPTVRDDFTS
ncbi:MAG TPA: glycoside hydrolase family 43 protein, partial [Polyangiaceae bacterium]